MSKKQVDVGNATVMPRDDYVETLHAIISVGFCPFCKEHLFKHHQKPLLCASRHWMITENSWPYPGSRFHFLFISQKHVERIEDLSIAAWADLRRMYYLVTKKWLITGATMMIRSGDTLITGASVNHLHAHLVAGGKRRQDSKTIKALVGFEE